MERDNSLVLPLENGQKESAAGDGAATVYASLAPAVGQIYIVDWACMIHDNVAVKAVAWYWYNGVTRTSMFAVAGVASTTYTQLYGQVAGGLGIQSGGHPLICNPTSYLQAGCVAAEVGKKVYINYLVRMIRGVEPWSNA